MKKSIMRLRNRLNIILSGIFIVVLSLFAVISYTMEHQQAKDEVLQTAKLILEMVASIRKYTIEEVAPLIDSKHAHQPQCIPAYAAIKTFSHLKARLEQYEYKESMLNPKNPLHRASEWEVELIRSFRNHTELKIIAESITEIEHLSNKSQQTIETIAQHVNVFTYATGEPILYTEPKIAATYYIYQGIVKIKHPENFTEDVNSCPIGKDLYEYWPSDVLKTVHQQLCLFMGPVSEQLVKQASNVTLDTRQLYLLLAENIFDKEEQCKFLALSPDYSYKIYMKGAWFDTKEIIMTEAFAQDETTLLEVPDDDYK